MTMTAEENDKVMARIESMAATISDLKAKNKELEEKNDFLRNNIVKITNDFMSSTSQHASDKIELLDALEEIKNDMATRATEITPPSNPNMSLRLGIYDYFLPMLDALITKYRG